MKLDPTTPGTLNITFASVEEAEAVYAAMGGAIAREKQAGGRARAPELCAVLDEAERRWRAADDLLQAGNEGLGVSTALPLIPTSPPPIQRHHIFMEATVANVFAEAEAQRLEAERERLTAEGRAFAAYWLLNECQGALREEDHDQSFDAFIQNNGLPDPGYPRSEALLAAFPPKRGTRENDLQEARKRLLSTVAGTWNTRGAGAFGIASAAGTAFLTRIASDGIAALFGSAMVPVILEAERIAREAGLPSPAQSI